MKNRSLRLALFVLQRLPSGRSNIIFSLLLFLVGWGLGLYSYITYSPSPPRGDEAFYWRQMIESSIDLVFGLRQTPSKDYFFAYAPYALPLSIGWLLLLTWLQLTRNCFSTWLTLHHSTFVCVCGRGALAEDIAKLQQQKNLLVIWLKMQAYSHQHASSRASLPIVYLGIAQQRSKKFRAALTDAQTVMAVDNSDLRNIELFQAYLDILQPSSEAKTPLRFILRIDNNALRKQISIRYQYLHETNLQLTLFSATELYLRSTIRRYPLKRFLFSCRPNYSHALIISFSDIGQHLLLMLLKSAHYTGGSAEFTVVDPRAVKKKEIFKQHYPQLTPHFHLDFKGVESTRSVVDYDLLLALKESGSLPTAVYICPPEVNDAMTCAIALERYYKLLNISLPPVYVLTSPDGSEDERFTTPRLIDSSPWLTIYRSRLDLIKGEFLQQQQLDSLAKIIHENYVIESLTQGEALGARPSLQYWPRLPELFKEDNRAQADHHYIKLSDIGCHAVKGREQNTFTFSDVELETLSIAEHRRWLAIRWCNGWRYDAVRNDDKKQHPDIVPWAELPEARREIDRQMVRLIPKYLAQEGLQICRNLYLILDIDDQSDSMNFDRLSDILARYVVRLSTLYPNARAVVVSTLMSPLACHVCRYLTRDTDIGLAVILMDSAPHQSNLDTCQRLLQCAEYIIIGELGCSQLAVLPGFSGKSCRYLCLREGEIKPDTLIDVNSDTDTLYYSVN